MHPAVRMFCIAIPLFALASCSKPVPVLEDVRPVRTMGVAHAQISSIAELAGEVRPRVEARVGFLVGGRIVMRAFEVGQTVKAGQVLATIDPAGLGFAAAAARAQLAAAQTDRDQKRADYRRVEELQRKRTFGSADLERRKAALDAAAT